MQTTGVARENEHEIVMTRSCSRENSGETKSIGDKDRVQSPDEQTTENPR